MQMVLQPAPANPPLLPGAADAMTLLRAVVDRPEDVRKFLSEWDEYLKRYEAMIEGYGGLVRINALIAEHERLADAATDAERVALAHIDQAKHEAGKIMQEGHADVDSARAALAVKQAALKERLASENKRIAQIESELQRLTSEATAKAREAEETLAATQARESAVNAQLEKMRAAGLKIEV